MELKAINLSKTFDGYEILDNLSFTAEVGVTCICAPSGIGKTTLLRILLGLEKADSGETNAADFHWAAVFQEDRLLEQLNAIGNLRLALGKNYEEKRAAEMLQALQLSEHFDKKVGEWSGGMKRRLALARALLAPSDAIALDEPLTGLDAQNREISLSLIRKEAEKKIILLVTHDETDAEALQAKIIRL